MSGPRFTKASVVGAQHARATWALAAREMLLETAGHYHAVVGYAELAEFVQQRSLISTTQQVGGWMGDVLHRVGEECARRAEPNLAALAVNAKGSVGDGYARSVAALYGEQVTDPDEHAARVRLECYRRFGADLPAGGGEPALAPALQKTRTAPRSTKAAAAPKAEPKPPALCPRCFTTLPATGICDYCD
ncbi:MAG: hypothetical protein ACXVW6_02905 [Nocardioidaceae bacterium]